MKPILLAIVCVCGLPAATPDPVKDWITRNAVRLETPEAGHGFADMAALKGIVGNARIVSLGEATHGTREFFQLKHRMLEYLATEMGFTIFSIEANMPEAYRLNAYVLKGTGDPVALLQGMYFWTWNTQEVLDMIRWMRKFNESGKGRVQFTGFDMQTPRVALDIAEGFLKQRDAGFATSEEHRKAVGMVTAPAATGQSFGVATASFPVAEARGKRVRFSGYIKTRDVTTGYAGFWWRVDGPGQKMLAFDNMQGRGPRGATDWTRYEIELPVAAEAININFGALFPGDGMAWFDGLKVELDGKTYDSPNLDLDFETPRFNGFFTGGAGYRIQRDAEVVHSGSYSLSMTRVADAPNAVTPKVASAAWKDIVGHMEASREVYAKAGASKTETEWAIQNARVVWQCLQMKANEKSRDRSMAENVKWILDQNPQAKIVLWAHNGHVGAASPHGFESMGSALRQMYGTQMAVFGFSFFEGSFQAIGANGGGLRDFTVTGAPEGTWDAAFASAAIPMFALDLRKAPKEGPVAGWLKDKRQARSIGAMYREEEPATFFYDVSLPEQYDAVLFVAKTTAARKNPK